MTDTPDPLSYTAAKLQQIYGLEDAEAQRLIARFGPSKDEIDRLLSGRGRTSRHRKREILTSVSEAAFGIR